MQEQPKKNIPGRSILFFLVIYIYIYTRIIHPGMWMFRITFSEHVLQLPGAPVRNHAGHAGWGDLEPKRGFREAEMSWNCDHMYVIFKMILK